MNKLYMLIGVPGSGKTTWYKNQPWMKDYAYISTDLFVEQEAQRLSKTYTEIFKSYMPTAVNHMVDAVIDARDAGQNIVWDQTSLTKISRTKKFKMLPKYYYIAIVFSIPKLTELKDRLENRPGRIIPWETVEEMIDKFEMPTIEEGFKEIWRI